jgi:hypothetical protein
MWIFLVVSINEVLASVDRVNKMMLATYPSFDYADYPVLDSVRTCVSSPSTCDVSVGLNKTSFKAFSLLALIPNTYISDADVVDRMYSVITGQDSAKNPINGTLLTLSRLYQRVPNEEHPLSFLVSVGTGGEVSLTSGDPLTVSLYNIVTSTVPMDDYTLSVMAAIIEGNATESSNLAAYNTEQVMSVSPGLSPGGADLLITNINTKDYPIQTDFSSVSTSQILINIVNSSAYEFLFTLLTNGGNDPSQIESAAEFLAISSAISASDLTAISNAIGANMISTTDTISILYGTAVWFMIN